MTPTDPAALAAPPTDGQIVDLLDQGRALAELLLPGSDDEGEREYRAIIQRFRAAADAIEASPATNKSAKLRARKLLEANGYAYLEAGDIVEWLDEAGLLAAAALERPEGRTPCNCAQISIAIPPQFCQWCGTPTRHATDSAPQQARE